jgi:hypothetical protein
VDDAMHPDLHGIVAGQALPSTPRLVDQAGIGAILHVPVYASGRVIRSFGVSFSANVTFLDPEEAKKAESSIGGALGRPWELWKRKALAKSQAAGVDLAM